MKKYTDRYLARKTMPYSGNERRWTWSLLISHGAAIFEESLYSEARAVAEEMMQRARHNVELLLHRLITLNYSFAYPDHVWIRPNPEMLQTIDDIEQQYGLFPLLLRTWFEIVGSVNFMGAHPLLNYYAEEESVGMVNVNKLSPFSTPLSTPQGDPFIVESSYLERVGIFEYDDTGLYEAPFSTDIFLRLA